MLAATFFDTVYRNTASEYFGRMGGAGRYDGYADWHPMGLTLLIGLRCMSIIDKDQLERCFMILPNELLFKCDGLAAEVERMFLTRGAEVIGGENDGLSRELLRLWDNKRAKGVGWRYQDFDTNLRLLLSPGGQKEGNSAI
jgi:hypothetical protein